MCSGHSQKNIKKLRVDFLPTALIFHTRLFETNRFRKFVSDFCRDRGLNPIFRNHDPLETLLALTGMDFAQAAQLAGGLQLAAGDRVRRDDKLMIMSGGAQRARA